MNSTTASVASHETILVTRGRCCEAPSPGRSSASCSMTHAAGPLAEAPTWDRRSCRWIILTEGAARPLRSATRHSTKPKKKEQDVSANTGPREGAKAALTHILFEGAAVRWSASSLPTGSATLPVEALACNSKQLAVFGHHWPAESLTFYARCWSLRRSFSSTSRRLAEQ